MSTSKIAGVVLLSLGAVALTGCRTDMQDQPKYKPLAESDFFADHRSARPQVEGTVARGHLRIDQARYTGRVNNNDIDYFPIAITADDVRRGQQRFDVYCAPCHGRIGDGQGLVVKRGFLAPPSYYTAKLMSSPVGHFFDVISNGFGAMRSYGARVAPDDRWRIAAYIRALQYSMTRTIADVPSDQRGNLPVLPLGPQMTNGAPPNPATMQGTVPEGPMALPPNTTPNSPPPIAGSGGPAPVTAQPKTQQKQ